MTPLTASCFSPVLSGSVPADLLRTTPQHRPSTLCAWSPPLIPAVHCTTKHYHWTYGMCVQRSL